ncbi:hypothetical protein WA588_006012 [Blastocystis sp. NMH]
MFFTIFFIRKQRYEKTMLFSQSEYVKASDLLEAFVKVAATTVGAVVAFVCYILVLVALHVTKVVSHLMLFVGDFLDLLADELIVCIYKRADTIAAPSHSNITAEEEDASITPLPEHNTHITEPVDASVAPEPVRLLADAHAQEVVAEEPAATESSEKVQPAAEAENHIEEFATVDPVPVAAAPAPESEDIAEELPTEAPHAPEPVQLFADTHAQGNHMEEPAATSPVPVATVEPEVGAEESQAAAAAAPEPAIIEEFAVAEAAIEKASVTVIAIEDPFMVEPAVEEPLVTEPAVALPILVSVLLPPHDQENHIEEPTTVDSTATESASLVFSDANCEKIENAPLNHIQNHIDEMEATTLASIISPSPLSVEELATSESVSADDAVSGPESGNMKSAVDFATAVVFGPAPNTYQMANYPPIREDFMKESQAMVPIDLMSQRIANQHLVMKVAEVLKLHLNSVHTIEAPKGSRPRCMVMAPCRHSLSEARRLSVPLLKEDIESEKSSMGQRVEEAVLNSSQPPAGKDAPASEKMEAARTSRPAAKASQNNANYCKQFLFSYLERASTAREANTRKGCNGAQAQPLAPLPMRLSKRSGETMEDRKGVNGEDSSSPRSSAPSSGRSTPSPTKKGVKGDQKKPATNASSKKKQEKRVLTPAEKKQNAKNYYHQRHKSD